MFGETIVGSIIQFILGFSLLTAGAELLVRGAGRLAARFNVPAVVIGLTIVAFGTSLPELLVSVVANLEPDGSDLAIGNIVGSNIANLALILGVAGLLGVIHVERNLLRREYILLLVVSFIFVAMAWNGNIARWEGLLLFAGIVAFIYFSYATAREQSPGDPAAALDDVDESVTTPSERPLLDAALVAGGMVGLAVGADWLVAAAHVLADTLGVSELIIGLTVVAIGTSLPELATTVIAVVRNEGDLAVGNVVGSNLFNMLCVGGVAAMVKPLPVPLHMQRLDFPIMIGITGLVYLLVMRRPHQLKSWKALLLLTIYIVYSVWIFLAG